MPDQKFFLSVIMPCRNEESTVGICIDDAAEMMAAMGAEGEIIVVDNASSDRSSEVAAGHGAKVIREENPGYGAAIRRGISEAKGSIILIGDADTTYDFAQGEKICEMLAGGEYDMVIGNRFALAMEEGAMSAVHRLGVKALSWMGRKRFHTGVTDFHCGLRAVTKEALERISLRTNGMEFATEMIAQAAKAGLRIGQIPVTLRRCELPRKSKLRTLRDGARHIIFILFG